MFTWDEAFAELQQMRDRCEEMVKVVNSTANSAELSDGTIDLKHLVQTHQSMLKLEHTVKLFDFFLKEVRNVLTP